MELVFEFLLKYWLELICSLFLGGVTIAAKFIWNTIKRDYLDAVKNNQTDIKELKESIDKKFDSIDTKFDNIETKINDLAETSRKNDLSMIRDTLLRKIRHGLQDTCVSLADVETVSALMAQYEELGGNGEVHKLYQRFEKLKVCPEYDLHVDAYHENKE